MSPELEQCLYTEFPMLYRMRHLDSPDMCCGWGGIQCKDGWFDLIRGLSLQIVEYANQHHLDPLITKVQKHGGVLMFKVDCHNDYIQKLCKQEAMRSVNVCEICGEPGNFESYQPYDIMVCCPKHVVERDDRPLNEDEIEKLQLFNDRLRELELQILSEGRRNINLLEKRIADPQDPLDDFEIEADLHFILRETDPDYREDDDNFLTKRVIWIPKSISEESIYERDISDWSESGRSFGIANHCYTFHDLYDHSHGPGQQQLSLRDILRIGTIWIDIDIAGQMYRDILKNEWVSYKFERGTNKG